MMPKENTILIKNTAKGKEVWYKEKRFFAEFPDKHWPLTTVKHLQWKIDDTSERSTDNLAVEENEKVLLNQNAV